MRVVFRAPKLNYHSAEFLDPTTEPIHRRWAATAACSSCGRSDFAWMESVSADRPSGFGMTNEVPNRVRTLFRPRTAHRRAKILTVEGFSCDVRVTLSVTRADFNFRDLDWKPAKPGQKCYFPKIKSNQIIMYETPRQSATDADTKGFTPQSVDLGE